MKYSRDAPAGDSSYNDSGGLEFLKMPEREKYGLRGYIKICVEESTRAALVTPDGTQIPELNSTYTNEFDEEGRHVVTRMGSSGAPEWTSRTFRAGHLAFHFSQNGQEFLV
jgi:hypothetical protein